MYLPCPKCKQNNNPHSVSPTEEPGLVMGRYRCMYCATLYRDRWAVASWHFWLDAGGQLAKYTATPPGITVLEDNR